MTRAEAEELAVQDAHNGERRVVPAGVEQDYEDVYEETRLAIQRSKRAELRRQGIIVPWWEPL